MYDIGTKFIWIKINKFKINLKKNKNNNFIEKLKTLSARRKMDDLTIGPVLTWSTEKMMNHINSILQTVPNSKLSFGGKKLKFQTKQKQQQEEEEDAFKATSDDCVPSEYGLIEPTAIEIPIQSLFVSNDAFNLCTKELFGPFQIIVKYRDEDVDLVLKALEKMSHHLTAAVVSNETNFLNKILSRSVNGTTYAGLRARTTGVCVYIIFYLFIYCFNLK